MIMITTAPAGMIASNNTATSSSSSSTTSVTLAEGLAVIFGIIDVVITVSVGTTTAVVTVAAVVGMLVVTGTSCVDDTTALVVPTQTEHIRNGQYTSKTLHTEQLWESELQDVCPRLTVTLVPQNYIHVDHFTGLDLASVLEYTSCIYVNYNLFLKLKDVYFKFQNTTNNKMYLSIRILFLIP